MSNKQKPKNKHKFWALFVVLLIGIIFILWAKTAELENPTKTVLWSIGCSLMATSISTAVFTAEDSGKDTEYISCILKNLGIDVDLYKRQNKALSFPSRVEHDQIEARTREELEKHKIEKSCTVGRSRPTSLNPYYDLIGATCDPDWAKYFALMLSSFWRHNSANKSVIADAEFDFVVTPKGGSPILGYEFAKIIGRPFVLHEQKERFQDNADDMRKWFDCGEVPEKGQTALIVDDSTTGGSMVIETIECLRKYEYYVHTCFVVFAPKVKDAEVQLSQKDIQLVSILETHKNPSKA